MKHILNPMYKCLLATWLCLLASSCGDSFLEIEPQQSADVNNAIVDLPSMEAALNGTYSAMQSNSYYGRSFTLIPDLMADNAFISSQNAGRYLNFDAFVVQQNSGYVSGLWNQIYEVIANTNLMIQAGEKLTFEDEDNQEDANQLIGEAYTIRALAYFDLLRLFGQPYNFTADAGHMGVPVITTSGGEIINPGRDSVKKGYEQVVSDFTKALSLLNKEKNNGKISINAAKGLLARVHLYMENWQSAADLATEVIESGKFSLVSNEAFVESWATDFPAESIFEIVNTLVDNPSTNALSYFYHQKGYGDALATKELYQLYEAGDVRQKLIKVGEREDGEETAYLVYKYPRGSSREDNIRVIGLPEVYLIRAEASAELGNEAQAQEDVQTLIQRALPSAPDVTATGDALKELIQTERRKELAFEGHRLFDLNRRKMDVNIIRTNEVIVAKYPNDRFILPIPLRELDANSNNEGMVQNPGYDN
ncbi:RagB/SusD family nutrient uptake outer membrane protein [Rapidithrix thailandica]|uniref:RagB/SusD family nutrient uptake outer membrane protein n=1 Tax=Rapidithrix thailandica TaxID=413964 RepID=A0AAW9SCT4_9BACT